MRSRILYLMTWEEMKTREQAAAKSYRKAVALARYARLTDLGAFQLNDAARMFRKAARDLDVVAKALHSEAAAHGPGFVKKSPWRLALEAREAEREEAIRAAVKTLPPISLRTWWLTPSPAA